MNPFKIDCVSVKNFEVNPVVDNRFTLISMAGDTQIINDTASFERYPTNTFFLKQQYRGRFVPIILSVSGAILLFHKSVATTAEWVRSITSFRVTPVIGNAVFEIDYILPRIV
ncbi:hypothetical protein SAMN06265347_107164 [Halobellus salinus]|nr:hypothetical protein SAMN06265347_107164 [Halobellus salinus]